MKRLFSLLIIIASLATSNDLKAQHTSFNLTYNLAQPVGESHEWTPKFSPRGLGLEYEYFLNENISLGLNVGWQVFYKKITNESWVVNENTQIFAAQFRYTNAFPINVTAKYYFTPDKSVIPFVGLGIGTTHIIRRLDMGPFQFKEADWFFGFYPEFGVKIPTDGSWNFHLAATYHYNPAPKDVEREQSWVGFKLGLSWDYHRW